jgi:hypothetical protein
MRNQEGCKECLQDTRTRPHTPAPEQCETCIFDGRRECISHGYPEETIPSSCQYKIGTLAVVAPIEAQLHNKQHDAAIARTATLAFANHLLSVLQDEIGLYEQFDGRSGNVRTQNLIKESAGIQESLRQQDQQGGEQ